MGPPGAEAAADTVPPWPSSADISKAAKAAATLVWTPPGEVAPDGAGTTTMRAAAMSAVTADRPARVTEFMRPRWTAMDVASSLVGRL